MATLISSSHGGFDQRTLSAAYIEARAKGDVYGVMRALGCPEALARKSAAYAEIRAANPNLSTAMEDRIVQQKLSIMGVPTETRTTLPSSDELARRVAAVGRLVAADKVVLPETRCRTEVRGHCDGCDDPGCGGMTLADFNFDEQEEDN